MPEYGIDAIFALYMKVNVYLYGGTVLSPADVIQPSQPPTQLDY